MVRKNSLYHDDDPCVMEWMRVHHMINRRMYCYHFIHSHIQLVLSEPQSEMNYSIGVLSHGILHCNRLIQQVAIPIRRIACVLHLQC